VWGAATTYWRNNITKWSAQRDRATLRQSVGGWICIELVSALVLSTSLRLVLLGPSSAIRRNQYGLVVPPRTMSIHSVKRENWRVVLSGALTKFLYYVFVSGGRRKEREREASFGSERTSVLCPDLNLPFNRPSTHGNARFIFCANFCLPLFGKVRLFSRSRYRDLTQLSSSRQRIELVISCMERRRKGRILLHFIILKSRTGIIFTLRELYISSILRVIFLRTLKKFERINES